MEIPRKNLKDTTLLSAAETQSDQSNPVVGEESKIASHSPSLAGLLAGGVKPPGNTPPSLRGSGAIQMNSAKSGIEAWPQDIVRRLAQFLEPGETLSFASVSRTIRTKLEPYVRYYTERNRCRHIETLNEFKETISDDSFDRSLSSPRGALPSHRGDMLVILGERIPALPQADQSEACKAFAEAASKFGGEKPAGFDELVIAANAGIDNLTLYLAKTENLRAARTAIAQGGHVGEICERYGIVDTQTRIDLQRLAMACPHIQDALGTSQSFADIADAYGIVDSNVREDMRVIELMKAMSQ